MYEQLVQFLQEQASFDKEIYHDIFTHFSSIKVKRKEMLGSPGRICKQFHFIKKGFLRLYEIENKGNEVAGYFALEDSIMTAVPSFIIQKPSRDFLVALEEQRKVQKAIIQLLLVVI